MGRSENEGFATEALFFFQNYFKLDLSVHFFIPGEQNTLLLEPRFNEGTMQ